MKFKSSAFLLIAFCLAQDFSVRGAEPSEAPADAHFIRVAGDGKPFVMSDSGRQFIPWGFNYDHDAGNRLLEYYWKNAWKTVAGDFQEMKELGANTVRIHWQVSR